MLHQMDIGLREISFKEISLSPTSLLIITAIRA